MLTGLGLGSVASTERAWWSRWSKSDSLITEDSEAPMPPVFMHSSTMITRDVFFTLSLIVFMSNGFSEMRSITCAPARA